MSPRKVHSSSSVPGDWQIGVYETSSGRRPALEYLGAEDVPDKPRRELLLTVLAVAEIGPLHFPSGTNRWRLMHKPSKKGDIDMSGIFEARDEHDRVLYRLFCLFDRNAPSYGPTIVLLGGGSKPHRTEMPKRIYQAINRNRSDYMDTRRLAATDTRPDWWPQSRN